MRPHNPTSPVGTFSKNKNMNVIATDPKEYIRANGKKDFEKAQRWVLTLNMAKGKSNPKDFDERDTMALRRFNLAAQTEPVSFSIFQPEIAPGTGTYHLQGYAEFTKQVSLAAVRKHFGDGVFAQIARGTPDQCIAYCSKEDSRVDGGETVRYGKPMEINEKGGTSGSRTDWKDAVEMLDANALPATVIRKHAHMLPCVRALHHFRTEILREKVRHRKTEVLVLWGSPDSGKSTTAFELARAKGEFFNLMTNGNALWWDGYDPLRHHTVVLDEFTGGKCPLTYLNMMLDKHPMQVEWKGGSYPFLAKRVIITSNYHPKSWYDFENPEKRLCWPALLRRLETIVRFDIRETATMSGSMLKEMLWIEVEKGLFNVKHVMSRYPIHSTQDDSDSSSSIQVLSTPPSSPVLTSTTRIRRQNAMDGLRSALTAIEEDE